jgi:hypothetical protein
MYLTLTSRNILEFPEVFCEEYVSCCRLFDIVEMFDTYNMLRSPFCNFSHSHPLQAGLFVYDIFWVFFTPVMVSVAKSFDAPIKVSNPTY